MLNVITYQPKPDDELADFIDQYTVIILLTRLAPS